MIVMNGRRLQSEHLRRWLIPAALLALLPKCVLCVLAYAGAGTILGWVGPEICGAAGPDRPGEAALPALGVSLVATLTLLGCRRGFMPRQNTSPLSRRGIKPLLHS